VDKRRTVACIIVVSDAVITNRATTVTILDDQHRGIKVGVLVAGVSNKRFASTSNLVPETTVTVRSASVVDFEASTSLTLCSVRQVIDLEAFLALVVGRRLNSLDIEVEETSRVQEASDINVVGLTFLRSEHHKTLPVVAAIIIHGEAVVDVTTRLAARREDKDD